jgi:hypothetical protein
MNASGGIVSAGTITGSTFVGDGSALTGIDNMNIVETNTSGTYYPVFVDGTGANRTMRADTTFGPLTYNPNSCELTVGTSVGTIRVGNGFGSLGTIILGEGDARIIGTPTAVNVKSDLHVDGLIYSAASISCQNDISANLGNIATNFGNISTITGTVSGTTLSASGGIVSAGTITGSAFVGNGAALTGIDNMNIVDTNLSGTYFPVFVGSTGANQVMHADATTGPLSYNPSTATLSTANFTASGTVTGVTFVGNGSALTGLNNMNIVNTDTSGTYYPVFVGGAGANQVMRADIQTGPFTYNPNTSALSLNSNAATLTVGLNGLGSLYLGGPNNGNIINSSGNIYIAANNTVHISDNLSISNNLSVTGTISSTIPNGPGVFMMTGSTVWPLLTSGNFQALSVPGNQDNFYIVYPNFGLEIWTEINYGGLAIGFGGRGTDYYKHNRTGKIIYLSLGSSDNAESFKIYYNGVLFGINVADSSTGKNIPLNPVNP